LDENEEMSRNLDSSRREIGELRKHNKSLKAKKKRMAEDYSSLLKGKETEVENAKECMARYKDELESLYDFIAEKQNELMEKEVHIKLLEENANKSQNYYSSQLKSYLEGFDSLINFIYLPVNESVGTLLTIYNMELLSF
jgi:septal ring factor EnvC (AmiA/AmiB activator)